MSEMATMSASEYCKQASALIERRRFAQARALLGEALGNHPDDADLLFEAARIDYLTNQHDAAMATVRHALALAPLHLNARYLLACIHEERQELVESEAVLLDLLRDYPELGLLYARYAMLMFRTFHIDKAKALAREALRLAPDDELALSACAMGDLIDGNSKTPGASLAAMVQHHPENAATAQLLIVHLVSTGQYWAAKRIAIELLKAQPDSREYLDMVVQLDTLSHWTILPLWPFNRWGMAATVGFFVLTMLAFRIIHQFAPQYSTATYWFLLSYMAYSWFYPPLLKRWLTRRAGL